jgi:hypothetical protein
MRERLWEVYQVFPQKTRAKIDVWRKSMRLPKPTFRVEEWGVDENNPDEVAKAEKKHINEVNRLYIQRTMTESDVVWVLEDTIGSLTENEQKHLESNFRAKLNTEPAKYLDLFLNEAYENYRSTEVNVKSYKRWKKSYEKTILK